MISTRNFGRTTLVFVAAAFVTAAAAPAVAEPDPKAPKAQETPQPGAKEKRYCVMGTTTGTLIPRKTCKTRDQWIAQQGFDPLDSKSDR
jgi:hypothetical protein